MQESSINLLVASLSLLCFVEPLLSDPQRSYWANYEQSNPVDPGSPQVHRVQVFSDEYDPSSVQIPLPHVTQYERESQPIYQINHFQSPSASLSYPETVPETKYLQTEGYRSYHNIASSNREENSNKDLINLGEKNTKSDLNEKEITEKMRILDKFLSEDSSEKNLDTNGIENNIIPEESRRIVREVRKQKPGFFWTLARITFESINDTRSAIKQISEIINNNIAPDSATQSTMMSGSLTAADSTNTGKNMNIVNATGTATTTQAPFVLTRSGLQSLIRRNVLGLVRLFNIEWKDALNQSEITVKEFQRDLGNQVGTFLRDNPDAY